MTQRKILRIIHIVGALAIGTYVYSPWSQVEWFAMLIQLCIIPLLALSGLWMWQQSKMKRWFKKL